MRPWISLSLNINRSEVISIMSHPYEPHQQLMAGLGQNVRMHQHHGNVVLVHRVETMACQQQLGLQSTV